jgi:2-dehydro-3-deoxyphosphogluconate aldolase / (4S)-4-hydroxy-2-oxoglutarate aldolase
MDELATLGKGAVPRPNFPEVIAIGRVVAIGRRLDPATVPAVATALLESGIRAFELTMDSRAAVDLLGSLARRFSAREFVVGAGTIFDLDEARSAVEAGAGFLVMPHLDLEIIRWAALRGIPCFPGAMTPTEILTAWRAGAAGVKLFPASAVGPSFVREMRGPMPCVPIVPTGGITIDNAPAFLAAGAVAVGMGSWLTGSGDVQLIRERACAVVAATSAQA